MFVVQEVEYLYETLRTVNLFQECNNGVFYKDKIKLVYAYKRQAFGRYQIWVNSILQEKYIPSFISSFEGFPKALERSNICSYNPNMLLPKLERSFQNYWAVPDVAVSRPE